MRERECAWAPRWGDKASHVRGQCARDTRTPCSHDQIAPALWLCADPISAPLYCLIRITPLLVVLEPVHRYSCTISIILEGLSIVKRGQSVRVVDSLYMNLRIINLD